MRLAWAAVRFALDSSSNCRANFSASLLSVDLVLRFIRLPWESVQQAVKNWLFPRFHMLAM
jgi:hypothetical protein